MKIITGADSNHKNYVKCIIEDCDRLNYPIQVYDYDGSLGFGKQFSLDFKMPQEKVYHAKIQMKPLVILDALYNSEPDELIVYVDSDIVIQHSFDEIDSKDYDVGLTLHPKGFYENNNTKNKNRVGLLNAGVLFFYNNERSKYFIRKWLVTMINETTVGSDQEALHVIALRMGFDSPDQLKDLENIKIKSFPSKIYNYSHSRFSDGESDAKIIHYPGPEGGPEKKALNEKRNLIE